MKVAAGRIYDLLHEPFGEHLRVVSYFEDDDRKESTCGTT